MRVVRSDRRGKKFKVVVDGKTVHFGDSGYRIKPGTPAGDRYCARSFNIRDGDGNLTRDDRKSANYWSRRVWRCRGRVSLR